MSTEPTLSRVARKYENILEGGLRKLVGDGVRRGHWGSARSTADALLALNYCLPDNAYPRLRESAFRYLVSIGEGFKTKRKGN